MKAARNRPSGRSARRIWISAPGKVVDRVERSRREDQVEARFGEGQAILVGVGPGDREAALAQPFRQMGARPEHQRILEGPRHQVEPLDQLVGHVTEQIVGRAAARGRAGAAEPAQGAVERSVAGDLGFHAAAIARRTLSATGCPPPDNMSGIGHGVKATTAPFPEKSAGMPLAGWVRMPILCFRLALSDLADKSPQSEQVYCITKTVVRVEPRR